MLRGQGTWIRPSAWKIIQHFLYTQRSIDFICVFDVRQNDQYSSKPPFSFGIQLFAKNEPLRLSLDTLFAQGFKSLPKPISAGVNARSRLQRNTEKPELDIYRYGVRTTCGMAEMKISARGVFDYLTGRIDRDQFLRVVGFESIHYLERTFNEGTAIIDIALEPKEESDDDYIVLKFGEKDPAVSKFQGSKEV